MVIKEIENSPNRVELLTDDGERILWTLSLEGDGYYSSQFIFSNRPLEHWQLNKQTFLSEDKQKAQQLFDSVIRHKKCSSLSEKCTELNK